MGSPPRDHALALPLRATLQRRRKLGKGGTGRTRSQAGKDMRFYEQQQQM